MITFNSVVSIFFVDMHDVIKMRIISVIYVANDRLVSRRFISANRNGPMEADTFNSISQKNMNLK